MENQTNDTAVVAILEQLNDYIENPPKKFNTNKVKNLTIKLEKELSAVFTFDQAMETSRLIYSFREKLNKYKHPEYLPLFHYVKSLYEMTGNEYTISKKNEKLTLKYYLDKLELLFLEGVYGDNKDWIPSYCNRIEVFLTDGKYVDVSTLSYLQDIKEHCERGEWIWMGNHIKYLKNAIGRSASRYNLK